MSTLHSPRSKYITSSTSGSRTQHHYHPPRDGSDIRVRTPTHQTTYLTHHHHHHQHRNNNHSAHHHQHSHSDSCRTSAPYQARQHQHQHHNHKNYRCLTPTKMSNKSTSGKQATASAISSNNSSVASSVDYYYGADSAYGLMQQEPAWLMATPIDDDDLTFGGKSLSTWYEEDRRRFSLGDDGSRTLESDEEEESRGRQRVRATYDAPLTSHRHHQAHSGKSDAGKH